LNFIAYKSIVLVIVIPECGWKQGAAVSIRQRTSAYVSIRHLNADGGKALLLKLKFDLNARSVSICTFVPVKQVN
jgi:hypothetical protein